MLNAWPQTVNLLQKTLNPGIFQVWIKPLDAEAKDGKLTLFAPNPFVASWVRDRLVDQIAEAATQTMGNRPEISVSVRSSAKKTSPAEPKAPTIITSTEMPKAKPERKPTDTVANNAPTLLGLPNLSQGRLNTFNWRFSFDDFVVGPSNELAYVASQSLCRGGMDFDQLFLNSAPGLGKTHMLQAMGRQMARECNRSNPRMAYLTAEEFARQMILAIKSREVEQFKARYRDKIDVLLLEDIHFLQGKQRTQDELLETLKALQSRGCKVVLSSSFLPRELKDVDDHLASRLCSGFLATMDRPDLNTRRNILERKAQLHQVHLPTDVSHMMAESLTDDVRQLESCLQSLVLKARLLGQNISVNMVEEALKNYTNEDSGSIDFKKIVNFICKSFELSQDQLSSKSRKRAIVMARNTAFYLSRKYTDMPLKQIGSHFNRRHSTVLKGITNVEREMRLQTPLGRQIDTVVERIKTF